MAGFFIPYRWEGQNGQFDIIKLNGTMYIAEGQKTANGITRLALVDPNGVERFGRDLSGDGVTHIFGVVAEPSRQTGTWKLGVLTFPQGQFGTGERTIFIEDTFIPVDWAQVAG